MTDFDRFRRSVSDIDSPAEFAIEIPVDQNGPLSIPVRALYIGGSGNVFLRMVNTYNASTNTNTLGANVLFAGVVAGTILPVRVQAVWVGETAPDQTTATDLVGLY